MIKKLKKYFNDNRPATKGDIKVLVIGLISTLLILFSCICLSNACHSDRFNKIESHINYKPTPPDFFSNTNLSNYKIENNLKKASIPPSDLLGSWHFNSNLKSFTQDITFDISFKSTNGYDYKSLSIFYNGSEVDYDGNVVYEDGWNLSNARIIYIYDVSKLKNIDLFYGWLSTNAYETLTQYDLDNAKNEGYQNGYIEGVEVGKQEGYTNGFNNGLNDKVNNDKWYQEGKQEGLTQAGLDPFDWLRSLGNLFSGVFGIELFKGFTIGGLILIPLVFSIVALMLGLFKKGGK